MSSSKILPTPVCAGPHLPIKNITALQLLGSLMLQIWPNPYGENSGARLGSYEVTPLPARGFQQLADGRVLSDHYRRAHLQWCRLQLIDPTCHTERKCASGPVVGADSASGEYYCRSSTFWGHIIVTHLRSYPTFVHPMFCCTRSLI